jgi:hypothetical protein
VSKKWGLIRQISLFFGYQEIIYIDFNGLFLNQKFYFRSFLTNDTPIYGVAKRYLRNLKIAKGHVIQVHLAFQDAFCKLYNKMTWG